jgi:hypothetical protein
MTRCLRHILIAVFLAATGVAVSCDVGRAATASASSSLQTLQLGAPTVSPPTIVCTAVVDNDNTQTSAQQSTDASGSVECTGQEDKIVWTWIWTDMLTGQVLDSVTSDSLATSSIATRSFEDKGTVGFRKVTFCYTSHATGFSDGGNHCSDSLSGL